MRARVLSLAFVALPLVAHAADPRHAPDAHDAVPRLERTSAREAQAAWMAVKGMSDAETQFDTIAKKRLRQKVCDDLIDLHAASDAGLLKGFVFRDMVRGRSWARPTMVLELSEAMKRFQAEYPGRTIAIGDVSQPGCGQVEHGVLVQNVTGDAAQKLLASTRLVLGDEALVEVQHAKDFPWESDRFGPPDQRVLVTTKLVGREGEGDALHLRVARTRHLEMAAPTPDELKAIDATLGKLGSWKRIASRQVTSEDAAGAKTTLWLSHFVGAAAKRQAVLITRIKPGRRVDWADVAELRVANWDEKKPGSFPDEVRWVVDDAARPPVSSKKKVAPPTPIAAVKFTRWALLYEAGHITHLSGIDADLSYVTVGDTQHFAVDLPAMDVPATWRWMEILEQTGRELGVPVDAILVDRKVKAHLDKTLPKSGPKALSVVRRGPTWRLLTIVAGHDAHHHLRIVEAPPAKEAAAKKRLGL